MSFCWKLATWNLQNFAEDLQLKCFSTFCVSLCNLFGKPSKLAMSSQFNLLPVTQSQTPKPQIFQFKLSNEAQQLLVKSATAPNLKLVVRNGELSLKINDQQHFKLANLPEPSRVDIYKKFSSSTYKNIGSISSKLVTTSYLNHSSNGIAPQQPIITKTLDNNATIGTNGTNNTDTLTKLVSKLEKKLINLLAYGPAKPKDLAARFKVSETEMMSFLKEVGMVYNQSKQEIKTYPMEKKLNSLEVYYVLAYGSYKDLDLSSKKFTDSEFKILKQNSLIAFDVLKYPLNHPARTLLKSTAPRSPNTSSTPKAINGLKLPSGPKSTKPNENSRIKSKPSSIELFNTNETRKPILDSSFSGVSERKDSNRSVTTPSSNRSLSSSPNNIPSSTTDSSASPVERKRKISTHDEAYFQDLATRFKTKYKEYEALYKLLQKQDKKDQTKQITGVNYTEQLRKLHELHKNLESWKKQLWNSVATE